MIETEGRNYEYRGYEFYVGPRPDPEPCFIESKCGQYNDSGLVCIAKRMGGTPNILSEWLATELRRGRESEDIYSINQRVDNEWDSPENKYVLERAEMFRRKGQLQSRLSAARNDLEWLTNEHPSRKNLILVLTEEVEALDDRVRNFGRWWERRWAGKRWPELTSEGVVP